jgi:hypothetical protein
MPADAGIHIEHFPARSSYPPIVFSLIDLDELRPGSRVIGRKYKRRPVFTERLLVYWSSNALVTRGSFFHRVEMLEDGEEFGNFKEF